MKLLHPASRRALLTLGVLGVGGYGALALSDAGPVTDASAAIPRHLSGLRELPKASAGLPAVPNSVRTRLPSAIAKPLRVSPLAKATGDGAQAQAFADSSTICLSVRLSDGTGSTGCGPRAGLDNTALAAPAVVKDGDGYVVAGIVPDGASSVEIADVQGDDVPAQVTGNVFVASTDEAPASISTVRANGDTTGTVAVVAP